MNENEIQLFEEQKNRTAWDEEKEEYCDISKKIVI